MPSSPLARCLAAAALCSVSAHAQLPRQPLQPHTLNYTPGKSITLSLPANLDIDIAASGLRRVRFMAQSPDGRIFATGMYNLADNTRGTVFIFDGWNPQTHRFTHVTHYLDHLRNPNNLAFWTDPASHQTWLYLPLTDKLVRYQYSAGDQHPASAPETLIRFPDYGLNYKYGGWHLTRTVAIAALHGRTRVYVSAGSSCNYCQEREVLRAAVVSMNPDGSDQRLVAQGLRNAVDLRFVPGLDDGALFATNMGDDHLGDELPEDTFFELDSNARPTTASPPPNYGWPTCYFANGKPVHDSTPLPPMPPPGDLSTESERPADAGVASHGIAARDTAAQHPKLAASNNSTDSIYGEQSSRIAAAGTNLAAQKHGRDPNANLGTPPQPLSSCEHVPAAYATFPAHSSPLGLAYFGPDSPTLNSTFLVALHGAGHPRIGAGYRVVQFTPADRAPRPFITGFLTTTATGRPTVHGRPCGILRLGPDTFLLTDDYLGLIYYVHPKPASDSVR